MDLKDRIESLRRMVEEVSRRERGRKEAGAAGHGAAGSCSQGAGRPVTLTAEAGVTVTRSAYPLDHLHGQSRLGSALSTPLRLVQVIARDFRPFPGFESTAFLDVETTGLAGGAGTLAFLVGIGRFESSSFHVTQVFLHDPAAEDELLKETTAALEGTGAIVTFNGKAFDVPLLETRYAMNRAGFPLADPLHVDLLSPSRRIWSPVLSSCSLASLEEAVLGLRRDGDIPGWLIPSVYAGYLRSGDPGAIDPVMVHNRLDILSLAALLARLAICFEEPTGRPARRDGVEALGAALHYESLGLKHEALRLYEESIDSGLPGDLLTRALWGALRLSRSERNWDCCLDRARALAASGGDYRAWIEIAKHHEHRSKDYAAALSAAQTALSRLSADRSLPPSSRSRARDEINHRIRRLERRLGRDRA
ncbi:MAG: ribonuclease H-like domain-containing protein [Ignavibacteriales bacterium]